MRKIVTQWNKGNFNYVYNQLKIINYKYTLENIERDFSKIKSEKKFCYLIYLLSKENTPSNTILICETLLYTDTFFYDIHPVVKMFLQQSLSIRPFNLDILRWIIDTYENHPDSPFSDYEIQLYKNKIDSK